MKSLLWFILAITPLAGFPQSTSPNPRLAGIVDIEDLKLAIIQPSQQPNSEILIGERQREGALDVLAIDSKSRTARLSGHDQPLVLALSNVDSTNRSVPGLALENVTLQTVLDLLAKFSDQNLLQHPMLPDTKFSLTRAVTNRNEAAQILTNALSEKRIAVVPDGPKFLLVAPQELVRSLTPRSAGLAGTNANVATEQIPPGSIHFTSATLPNVLMIYAAFSGGKLDQTSGPLRDGRVVFKMQTALTKEECLYAFETLVGWHGIKLVPTGTGLFKGVSTN